MDIQCGCVYLDEWAVACKNVKLEEKLENINEPDQERNEQQQERENPEGNVVEELDVIK